MMDSAQTHALILELTQKIMPLAIRRIIAKRTKGTGFIHYTSAEGAMNIIRSREVWLRKPSLMNDFSETEYGVRQFRAVYRGELGEKFKMLANSIFLNFSEEFEARFEGHADDLFDETYISCFSEHEPLDEPIGRLSMWRAYGSTSGVAFVLRPEAFLALAPAFPAITSPVEYLSEEGFRKNFQEIISNLESSEEIMESLGRSTVLDVFTRVFLFGVLCTKHPGFQEEREWRVIHSKFLGSSDHIKKFICSVRGIPQVICSIPLKNSEKYNLRGIDIPNFIEGVIIGPSNHANEIKQAIVSLLGDAGMDSPASKVVVSGIPLRM